MTQMIPPGSLSYYYTIEMTDGRSLVSLTDDQRESKEVTLGQESLVVPKVNYLEDDIEMATFTIKDGDLRNWKALPRHAVINEAVEERPKSPWNFSKSLFTSYIQDTDSLMLSCFEYDWSCSKLERLLKPSTKDQRDRIYNYLSGNYRVM